MNEANNENMNGLERAIVGAIAFFDMFDYPLTPMEIWKYIGIKCVMSDVQNILNKIQETKSLIRDLVSFENGLYFLQGRNEIIKIRLKRYIYADRKFKRALRIAKIFKFIPWIKMIAVSNVIGAHNLKDESDIDIFIITKAKKIWLTRFFCAGLTQILGLRPKKGNERDKICLNFYVSAEDMNLERLMLENKKDIYFIYWLAGLVPIYGNYGTYKKFIQSNIWIKNYFPNWQPVKMVNKRFNESSGSITKKIINFLFGGFENLLKKIQLKKMPQEMKEMINKDTRVVVSDSVLKLHVNDRREEYRKKFYNKLSTLLSS